MKTRALITGIMACLFLAQAGAGEGDQKKPIGKLLYQVISEQGLDAGLRKYEQLKQNQAGEYNFDESQLNALGYRFVAENKLKEAIAIFERNRKSFPQSPNAHDSLAESYLRSGEYEKAKELYERTLELLASSEMNENAKNFLRQNAEAKLAFLNDPSGYMPSTAPVDFLQNNAERPFGRLHPDAPPETEHWGRLAGEWDCTIQALLPNGNWAQGGKAKWIWKYVLDGFAVQDLWYTKWIDLPPSSASINRDFVGTNIRMYLPAEERWECVWFANSKNTTSRFEAISSEEKIVMNGENNQGLTRITFYNFTEDSFDWKSEQSTDGGETWQETLRIHGDRVR